MVADTQEYIIKVSLMEVVSRGTCSQTVLIPIGKSSVSQQLFSFTGETFKQLWSYKTQDHF